jgi:hypothetical protein
MSLAAPTLSVTPLLDRQENTVAHVPMSEHGGNGQTHQPVRQPLICGEFLASRL